MVVDTSGLHRVTSKIMFSKDYFIPSEITRFLRKSEQNLIYKFWTTDSDRVSVPNGMGSWFIILFYTSCLIQKSKH